MNRRSVVPIVNCPVCKGELSAEAPTCPRCGHPQPGKQIGDKVENGCVQIFAVLMVIAVACGVWNLITTGEFKPKKKDAVPFKAGPIPR
jgi:hypothetical protein